MSGSKSGLTKSDEQENIADVVAKNEANLSSEFDANTEQYSPGFESYTKNINEGKQGKHIPGHSNFQPGRSELTITMSEADILVKLYSGKGNPIGKNKERVDFKKNIGYYVDKNTGKKYSTTIGIIHYSKNGTHIVPARPKEN